MAEAYQRLLSRPEELSPEPRRYRSDARHTRSVIFESCSTRSFFPLSSIFGGLTTERCSTTYRCHLSSPLSGELTVSSRASGEEAGEADGRVGTHGLLRAVLDVADGGRAGGGDAVDAGLLVRGRSDGLAVVTIDGLPVSPVKRRHPIAHGAFLRGRETAPDLGSVDAGGGGWCSAAVAAPAGAAADDQHESRNRQSHALEEATEAIARQVSNGSRAEPGEPALLPVLVHPLVQGAERLSAAAHEDGAESIEIVSEVAKAGHGIGGEAGVLTFLRDCFERPHAPNEVLVRQRLVAEVVPNQGQRGADAQLEAAVAAEKLTARERAAVVRAIRLDEFETGGAEHRGQLRRSSLQQLGGRGRRLCVVTHARTIARPPRARRWLLRELVIATGL